ncbi:uncharacterized protein LOC129313304 [Prosopis cineraria]|uniref:uncharacterized protein LOC129313304 n=1 Tax=Prosopis cineraria TaxID=364024 RepID=UPI00240EB020|nr:uncharacterized protein LOC129313304 [Prosopis cineraria]
MVGDKLFLKVSPMKGVMRFGKKGKLSPRYVDPFEILERIGAVAYRLALLPEWLLLKHRTDSPAIANKRKQRKKAQEEESILMERSSSPTQPPEEEEEEREVNVSESSNKAIFYVHHPRHFLQQLVRSLLKCLGFHEISVHYDDSKSLIASDPPSTTTNQQIGASAVTSRRPRSRRPELTPGPGPQTN